MPDRSKKRKRHRNKRKNNSNTTQNSKVSDAGAEAASGDEIIGDSECEVTDARGESYTGENQIDREDGNSSDRIQSGVSKNGVEQMWEAEEQKCKYVVETPEQAKSCDKPKMGEVPKSKSLDDIDAPKIVEVTENRDVMVDDSSELTVVDNVLVCEAESDVEWEIADLLPDGITVSGSAEAVNTLTVNTGSMNVAECEQTQALSPEEELSLRQYLKTLNLVTCPQEVQSVEVDNSDLNIDDKDNSTFRKKASAEVLPRPKQRFLEVIDEEGSNESSQTSRRESFLKDDYGDLEDDVFYDKAIPAQAAERFPLTRSVRPKRPNLIPQECLLVGAKIVQSKIDEARGDWKVENMNKINGAEVVYLTSSSSSASDIHDIVEESEEGEETDDSIRIQTPTIEHSQNLLMKPADKKTEPENKSPKTPPPSPRIITSDISNTEKLEENKFSADNKEMIVHTMENQNPSLYVLRIGEECEEKEDVITITKCALSREIPEDLESLLEIKKELRNPVFKLKEAKSIIDTEINDLKLELNNAISNLMKEVEAEKENEANNSTTEHNLSRQDSSSSAGSQCTTKHIPTTSSLTDIANLVHDSVDPFKPYMSKNATIDNVTETKIPAESHVKDVFERVTGSLGEERTYFRQPNILKDLCVSRIASLPYGQKILEELATVSEKLQNINLCATGYNPVTMPFYPLPDVTSIKNVALPKNKQDRNESLPPPVTPRNSSLKQNHDEPSWIGVQTKRDPSLYVCLSPSQKMLMEKTKTVIDKEDTYENLDIHQKYVDRRGYTEYYPKYDTRNKDMKCDKIPFKSRTGNRLLAIISDPAAKINRWGNYASEDLHLSSSYTNISKEYEPINPRYSKSARDVRAEMTFRPIPPPRPRKYSSTLYESDESSDLTDHSFQSITERKYFHYSTGHLNKDIEKDVSDIQNMHRKYTSTRDTYQHNYLAPEPRRPSLPRDICEKQMDYIRRKEQQVEAEIRKIEYQKMPGPKPSRTCPMAPLFSESNVTEEHQFDGNNYHISRKRDVALHSDIKRDDISQQSSSFKSSQEEIMREKMYSEYMCQMAEREDRKQHKVIKITTKPMSKESKSTSTSMPMLHSNDVRVGNNKIEEEFISKAKERWDKLGIKDPETDVEENKEEYKEPQVVERKIKVIEGGEEKEVHNLPSHLREFVQFAAKGEPSGDGGGESTRAPSLFVLICAVVIVMLAIGKRMIPMFRQNRPD